MHLSLFVVGDKMWLTPEVKEHLIYWKNPRDSGIAFGSVLVILLAVKYVSIISVVANLALALITSTMAFRIYKSVLSVVNKSSDAHPFKVQIVFFSRFIPFRQVLISFLINLISTLKKQTLPLQFKMNYERIFSISHQKKILVY